MTRNRVEEMAKTSKVGDSAPDRSAGSLRGAVSSNARMEGSVCSFEAVRKGAGDAELARLAELQHGHVHLRQLRAAGIGKKAVAHRVRTGRLHYTLPGVYLVGRPHRTLPGRIMAAALYLKGDALISSRSAAQVWGMLDTTNALGDTEPIHVLVVGRSARTNEQVVVHRAKAVSKHDIRRRNGIPVTSPARTLLDLAGSMDSLELESALSTAFRSNLVRRSDLADVMERNPHAKGIAMLRALLEQAESLHDTRSKYERKLLKLLSAAELPLPITNTWVAGRFVDGAWPDLKLVYEFDSWLHHRDKFEKDRLRDQQILVAGHRSIRVSGRQIDHTPYALVARFATVITMLRLERESSPAA